MVLFIIFIGQNVVNLMFSLVYKSTAVIEFEQYQIVQMLETARVKNRQSDISGCLLYYEGHFLQYLEGKQLAVLRLFDKIKEDKRHRQLKLLSYGDVEHRLFKDWDMAYQNFYGTNCHLEFLKLSVKDYLSQKKDSLEVMTKDSFWTEVYQFLK